MNPPCSSDWSLKPQADEMRCPKCGRFELRESAQGTACRICGYTLSPGENDKFRLYRLLKEEEKGSKRPAPRQAP